MSELRPANPYAAPQAPIVTTIGPGRFQYRPLAGRALAVTIPLGLFCLFSLLAIVLGVGVGSSAMSWNEAYQDESPITTNDLVEFGEGVAVLATIIALCFLLPQANRNSRALVGEPLRFSPASTMWWFFVPFMNLVRPYQAVREIWQSSTSTAAELWSSKPGPVWMKLWWATWLAFNAFSRFTDNVARRAAAGAASMSVAETFALVVRITGIVAAACLIYGIQRIATAQAERFRTAQPDSLPYG